MTNKKNRLITFFVSLIPGAGEMYLGFYKTGVSIMSLFWGTIALFGTLLPPIFYLLPVLWFYSFFHTHNLNSMSDEEFYTLEDDYLFHIHPQDIRSFTRKNQKCLALVLILMGISIIWNHLSAGFRHLSNLLGLSSVLLSFLHYWVQAIPQLVAAFLVILIGIKLIQDKKDTLETLPRLNDRTEEEIYQDEPETEPKTDATRETA